MTSEKRAQKFHADDVLLLRSGSDFDWLKHLSLAARPIRSTTQTWVVTRHQYGISEVVPQTLFRGKPVLAATNVGCFLRLAFLLFLCLFCNADFTM